MNKKVMGIIIAVILVLGGGYFGYQALVPTTPQTTGDIEITHKLGTVIVPANPKTVVVFDYATLDTLDSLGVEVTGVVKKNIPTYLAKFDDDKYTDIGSLFEPNYETLAAMKPDVIFISGRQQKVYDQLSEIAPTVFIATDDSDYIGSLHTNVNMLANMFNKQKVAEEKLAKIDKDIKDLQQKVEKTNANALILIASDGELSAFGKQSRFGVLHNTFGMAPVDSDIEVATHGQTVGFEYVVEKNPDYIFVVDRNQVLGKESSRSIFDNDLMKNTKSYQQNHIVFLNPEAWYLASGGLQSTEMMIQDVTQGI